MTDKDEKLVRELNCMIFAREKEAFDTFIEPREQDEDRLAAIRECLRRAQGAAAEQAAEFKITGIIRADKRFVEELTKLVCEREWAIAVSPSQPNTSANEEHRNMLIAALLRRHARTLVLSSDSFAVELPR